MRGSLAPEAQQLAAKFGDVNQLVKTIGIVNAIQLAFQRATAKWKQRITDLEEEVERLRNEASELRKEIEETRAIISPLGPVVGTFHTTVKDLVGDDGNGGQELKAMMAGWEGMDFLAADHQETQAADHQETQAAEHQETQGSDVDESDTDQSENDQ